MTRIWGDDYLSLMWQNDEHKMGWPARIFLMAGLLISITGLFYFMFGPKDPAYDWRRPGTRRSHDALVGIGDRIVLPKDQGVMLPKLKLVYRGLEKNRLLVEVTLLEMDPDVAYLHRIDPNRSASEIKLGGRAFRLDSWRRSRVRLELVR
ncbi:hypothetical protein D3OALGA1CA_4596 [Olavius algarvensis associated proteobacterium Delta 3]|nr:hypothetical protein D3OALGB2SA_2616 [Olavius algarvensis associated proteobacterium Delta 3]CAB5153934.1 hypothetical protein D3OALGA1CA_4596 [Olavius algarvensis associated proteobacterium Delta 3]